MNYADFINDVRIRFGTQNNAELERFLGLSNGYLSKFENGKIKDPNKLLYALASKGFKFEYKIADGSPLFISVPPDENSIKPTNGLNDVKILHEKAHKWASPLPDTPSGSTIEKKPRGIPLVFESDKEFEDGIVIPVLGNNPVSAGHGEGIGDGELPTRYIHAPKELGKYPHLMSLPVRGDSMTPTLNDGDMVVCDGGGWDGDGIYVIKTIDETFVKRVQHTPQGYRVVSDNKLYESYTGSAEEIAIVGRVRAMVVMVPGRRGGV